MKKIIYILFVLFPFSKSLQGQTQYTIDSLREVRQACFLERNNFMIECVVIYTKQMDSLIQLSLKKIYAKGNKAANLTIKNNQENWLAKRKAYYLKAEKKGHEDAVKEGYVGGTMERLFIQGDKMDFVEKRAEYLVRKLNSH